jgi:uncharacterized protein
MSSVMNKIDFRKLKNEVSRFAHLLYTGFAVHVFCFIVILLSSSTYLAAQNVEKEIHPKIEVIARAKQDAIMLRWAPNTPGTWKLANKYGYIVERYTLLRDGVLLDNVEKEMIAGTPIKPIPLEDWEALADRDDYAAIAAQALYGEEFDITEDMGDDMTKVVNQSNELETRFSFALFAADQSLETAEASGLMFVDKTAKKNEKYLYRVYTPIERQKVAIDTGFVYIGIADYKELPKPLDLKGDFMDRAVMLSWNRLYFENTYNSYIVERSDDDGKTFQPISEQPLINTYAQETPNSDVMFKLDSLPENNKNYAYRIKGISPFGEISPPSDTIVGMGKTRLEVMPVITNTEVIDNKIINIIWEMPPDENVKIAGFKVNRTDNASEPYETLIEDLDPTTRTYTDLNPNGTNYYVVQAVDEYGSMTSSFPMLAQLIDSFPPLAPVQIVGKIDTTGIVHLSWKANEEEDLLGYRVYWSNFLNAEYTQITKSAMKDNFFVDTVSIETLTKKVFYKVVAIDQHFNHSALSESFALKRPDIIPPVPPVFTAVNSTSAGINLTWVKSSSEDVVNHLLYRRTTGESGWRLLAVFDNIDTTAYSDLTPVLKKQYEYTIIAIDDSKLESEPAKPVKAKRIDNGIRAEIKKVFVSVDRDNDQILLAWEYPEAQVENFLIYRAEEGELSRLYKLVPGADKLFKDETLSINTVYRYRVKAAYIDGGESPFSKEIVVKY